MRRFVVCLAAALTLLSLAACDDGTQPKICKPGEVRHESTGAAFVCVRNGREWTRLDDIEVNG